ncbi:efflux RND transporter periplasmic adaptor subunit [Chryseobacterium sp. BIGb0232]|uniref:efflux RND transporter periplasmic adaptor subunit n=1 Tax=Chryseobacterium sp. BIGb0232 TaxID=2940598 RepID=UPI000F468BC4|nr:efflux RND transporter periplasmic adaptor subunit [Chryseobacterium sp. BIGb0232]MCS4301577.1 RND family efflux transporter MFP subunit [Chryseobacterium sp. BIGb0232]ROS19568.1 RND family efflux transporter MFP subunit [Chryseobacterium nakagawai]
MKTLLYTAAILTLMIIPASCSNEKTTPQQEAKPMMMASMETVAIKKSNPKVELKLPGELVPDQETALFAKVQSYVKKINVDIGSYVTAGQVLIVLEAPEIQSQAANAKAKWQAQEAIYASTKSSYNRMYKANETKGAIAKDALDQITARKLSDEAQVNAARSAYRELQEINQYLVIRAPFSGIITERNVDLGAYVGPMGGTPLMVIQNTSKLRLSLSVSEANVPYLNVGDTISFRVNAIPEKNFKATISRKSGSLDLKLRSEKIEADFINHSRELKPFMMAESMIPLQNKEATFFIPRSAVVESNMGIYIIKKEHGKAKFIPIKKGRVLNDTIEVFGELSEGDQILKKANEEITEGSLIK